MVRGFDQANFGVRLNQATDGFLPDPVFAAMAKELGNPPIMFFDLRPVSYPMVVINSHEVAEEVSRSSTKFPWSTPKSPTLGTLVRVIGPESILVKQVGGDFPSLGRGGQVTAD